ncbi:MAG: hypothetical protein WBV79_10170, partial [Rhodomicrobium sp.]
MSLSANLFQAVAFAADPLHGNSAFALTGVGEATERQLTTVCAMLRTAIIAVVGRRHRRRTPLRFFTAAGPHKGASHATLDHMADMEAIALAGETCLVIEGTI